MVWKIYAWIYAILMLLAPIDLVPSIGSWNFPAGVGVMEGILLAIGVLLYSYKRRLPNKEFWGCIFVLISIIVVLDVISIFRPLSFLEMSTSISKSYALLTMLFSIPALIAIYRLGFTKQDA
jgi:hypothetical protein